MHAAYTQTVTTSRAQQFTMPQCTSRNAYNNQTATNGIQAHTTPITISNYNPHVNHPTNTHVSTSVFMQPMPRHIDENILVEQPANIPYTANPYGYVNTVRDLLPSFDPTSDTSVDSKTFIKRVTQLKERTI